MFDATLIATLPAKGQKTGMPYKVCISRRTIRRGTKILDAWFGACLQIHGDELEPIDESTLEPISGWGEPVVLDKPHPLVMKCIVHRTTRR